MDNSIPVLGKFCLFAGDTGKECVYPAGRTWGLFGLIVFVEEDCPPYQYQRVHVLTALGTIDACTMWDPKSDRVVEIDNLWIFERAWDI